MAQSSSQGATVADMLDTPEQATAAALRQAIGAPARADIGDQATVRLDEGLLLVPKDPAAKLLTFSDRDVPAGFAGLLLGSEGMDAPGVIRFVPAGFIDSDAALAWSADDILASLKDTVEHGNAARAKANLEPLEARRWILPPHYDPEAHQLSWAALIVPQSAPRESDGAITVHAIGFGRNGYVEMTVITSVQKADEIRHMADSFLLGLTFRPEKAYGDVQPADRRAASGLAGAMGLDSLHKADLDGSFWASDTVVPVAGGTVAAIGALALILHLHRNMKRESRRL
jgi:uncharacterized membrane-anchored protein